MTKRALVSVTDKRDLGIFGVLARLGWEFISTGGTAGALEAEGIMVTPVERVTGFPEMMNGRLKTIHPIIFGGILADRNKPSHMEAVREHGIALIDLVVVNLYDFTGNPGIEQIDIGGPSLLRAAAKNHESVTVVVDPDDYQEVVRLLSVKGEVNDDFRRRLAGKTFEHTARYDRAIADWFAGTVE